jgi:YidC/Oxa1 family membrane protein insertase
MDFQRLILFVIFAMSGVFLFQAWQKENAPPAPPKPVAPITAPAEARSDVPTAVPAASSSNGAAATTASTTPAGAVPSAGTAPAAAAGEILTIRTDLFEAKINTLGGVIEEVALKEHRDAADKSKPYLVLLKDKDRTHIAQSGLIGAGLPNHTTAYSKVSSNTDMGSAESLEVRLSAPNVSGGKTDLIYTFKRGSYIVDVAYDITNGSAVAINPGAYFHLHRDTKITGSENGMVGIFHGPAVYTDQDKYKKIDFKDIEKGKKNLYTAATDNGWVGTVEHYFVNAWLPKAGMKREYYTTREEGEIYRAGLKTAVVEIPPGATGKVNVPIYMGPQEQDRLKAAATGLDLVVDYGMFTFIAAPMFLLLRWFHSMVANWGWAIVLLTILIKGVFYPLNAAAGRSMGKMKLVGPKLKEIQAKYADDRVKLNQAMMELYKKEKINPLGGCLPIVIQIPVFIALYWVLIAAVELRHAPWILWIKDLSGPDPFFVLPALYAITAFAQSKLQPPAPGMDPIQQKVLQYMPVAFAVMFVFFPAGLVLYWTVSNLLQIVQQWRINTVLQRENDAQVAAAKR